VYHGLRGMVKEIVENYATELGDWPDIIATGGDAETLFGGYFGGSYRELMAWILLIVVLLVRPFGLFGSKDIERV